MWVVRGHIWIIHFSGSLGMVGSEIWVVVVLVQSFSVSSISLCCCRCPEMACVNYHPKYLVKGFYCACLSAFFYVIKFKSMYCLVFSLSCVCVCVCVCACLRAHVYVCMRALLTLEVVSGMPSFKPLPTLNILESRMCVCLWERERESLLIYFTKLVKCVVNVDLIYNLPCKTERTWSCQDNKLLGHKIVKNTTLKTW